MTEHGLTPVILEEFLNNVAREFGCRTVVDPFIGSGTVAVEALKYCYSVIGIDANPWALIVTKTKTTKPKQQLVELMEQLLATVREPLVPSKRLHDYHTHRQLEVLGNIRAAIERLNGDEQVLALTVFGELAYNYSLLKRTPAPQFRKSIRDPNWTIVVEEYIKKLRTAIEDLWATQYCGDVQLIFADSAEWLPRRIECLVTSPPFANNVDYIRHTMLYLLWAGIAKDSKDLGWLRSIQTPSCEAATRSWRQQTTNPIVLQLVESIRGKRAKGYRRFLLQYFYTMERHIELLAERLEGIAWYTIGDSILGGVYIPTHRIIADIAVKHGLRTRIKTIGERFREGRNLYLLEIVKRY